MAWLHGSVGGKVTDLTIERQRLQDQQADSVLSNMPDLAGSDEASLASREQNFNLTESPRAEVLGIVRIEECQAKAMPAGVSRACSDRGAAVE